MGFPCFIAQAVQERGILSGAERQGGGKVSAAKVPGSARGTGQTQAEALSAPRTAFRLSLQAAHGSHERAGIIGGYDDTLSPSGFLRQADRFPRTQAMLRLSVDVGVVKEGDDIRVKVIGVEDNGRVKLSRKAVLKDDRGQR